MKLIEQLEILKMIHEAEDIERFKEQYIFIKENFISELEVKQIDDFVNKILKKSMEESDQNMEEIRLRCHLILNKEIIPGSYIEKNYFKKSALSHDITLPVTP